MKSEEDFLDRLDAFGLHEFRELLRKFDIFLSIAQGLKKTCTYEDKLAEWESIGKQIDELLKGGSKRVFLRAQRKSVERARRRYSARERGFIVGHNVNDLWACLYWYTARKTYADEQREHEAKHVALYQAFQPPNGDKSPQTGYSLELLSDGNIIPYANFYRLLPGLDMRESLERSPLALYEEWGVETIRAMWQYLREGVYDCSDGDSLILRNAN